VEVENDRYGTSLFFEEKRGFVIERRTTQERNSARKVVIAGEQIFDVFPKVYFGQASTLSYLLCVESAAE
jgi:hypothetical protein